MELNKEIEVFAEETQDEEKERASSVEKSTPSVEENTVISNEVAIMNANNEQALVWSKEKTGPEKVCTIDSVNRHFKFN